MRSEIGSFERKTGVLYKKNLFADSTTGAMPKSAEIGFNGTEPLDSKVGFDIIQSQDDDEINIEILQVIDKRTGEETTLDEAGKLLAKKRPC